MTRAASAQGCADCTLVQFFPDGRSFGAESLFSTASQRNRVVHLQKDLVLVFSFFDVLGSGSPHLLSGLACAPLPALRALSRFRMLAQEPEPVSAHL